MNEYDSWIILKQLHTAAQFLEPSLHTVSEAPDILSNPETFSHFPGHSDSHLPSCAPKYFHCSPTPLLAVLTREAAPEWVLPGRPGAGPLSHGAGLSGGGRVKALPPT